MEENSSDKESLYDRIKQLEKERDELQKDIEQLCMQQAGPSFTAFASQMYCRRTAGLEQEVENLKKKLADCMKENSNITEELSEAKRIKTHLDQLHKLEVAKNTEIGKQLEYLRGVVANAFADRDHAILEAEKAKENEDILSQKVNDAEKRLQELSVGSTETQEQILSLKTQLTKQEQEIQVFRKIIDKFYKIRNQDYRGDEEQWSDDKSEDVCWDDKCACLSNDSPELWSFNVHNNASTANYVADLQEEVETLRSDLQSKMQMGWEIEKHLKSRVTDLQRKMIVSDRRIGHMVEAISSIREYHSHQKTYVMKLLDDERSYLQSVVSSIEEKIGKLPKEIHPSEATNSTILNASPTLDSSEVLSQALQEKVSALLLLSQQEERQLFEKNVHAAVQETLDELQRALQLVTQEKVNALLELAEAKREYQQLLEKTTEERSHLPHPGEKRIAGLEKDGRFKNLLKKSSLKRWLGTEEIPPLAAHGNLDSERSLNRGSNHSMNDARLRIEIATLKESMQNLERLTSDIRKLRVSLIQAKHTRSSKGASSSTTKVLDEIIKEAEMVKTALSAALPLSWSGVGDVASSNDIVEENSNPSDSNAGKIDSVSAAGIEMVELLILAAQVMKKKEKKKEKKTRRRSEEITNYSESTVFKQ